MEIAAAISQLLRGPQYPDREFVRGGATFGEVYAMAAWLRQELADPALRNIPVCLAAENKAIIAAALLASLAGGPSLLLPYAFSGKVLARMQQTTRYTIAVSEVDREFPEGVKTLRPQPGDTTQIPVDEGASLHDELLKVFTGGSTGTPQVWSKTAENIFGECLYQAEKFAVTEHDCIMATIPAYHIYGLLFSVGVPLVSSAAVVDQTPTFPQEIAQVAKERGVTILASVPVHYRVLREVQIDSPLRFALSSAGMLEVVDNEAFCHNNNTGVVEIYGSTETGGVATRNRSLGEEFLTPFATVDWKVIDGRLAVRSPYISPDLEVDEHGFYLAGDRVEIKKENCFALKGRADSVTKVGGKRVDLEEIRLLIKKEPGVTDCVVLALPESGGREHQIGALIQGQVIDTESIRRMLSDSLEPYAVPRRIRVVDAIPVKDNGKYDRAGIVLLLQQ